MDMQCKCVIFDLDGTLIDAYQNITDNANKTLAGLGYPPLTIETVHNSVGKGPRDFWEKFVPPDKVDEAESIYVQRVKNTLLEKTYLLPGVKEVLDTLKNAGIKMAVASNKPGNFSRPLLKHLDIGKYFGKIICGDEIENMKPHPESIFIIMKEFGVLPEETIYVGDMIFDVKTAQAAGVQCIAVLTGSGSREELEQSGSCLILDSVSELPKYVLNGKLL